MKKVYRQRSQRIAAPVRPKASAGLRCWKWCVYLNTSIAFFLSCLHSDHRISWTKNNQKEILKTYLLGILEREEKKAACMVPLLKIIQHCPANLCDCLFILSFILFDIVHMGEKFITFIRNECLQSPRSTSDIFTRKYYFCQVLKNTIKRSRISMVSAFGFLKFTRLGFTVSRFGFRSKLPHERCTVKSKEGKFSLIYAIHPGTSFPLRDGEREKKSTNHKKLFMNLSLAAIKVTISINF